MARNLPNDALNKIAERLGNRPVTIIEVDRIDGDAPLSCADRTVGPIPGRILEVGPSASRRSSNPPAVAS